ncbi:MAG: gamma-glutamylcyclotransferase family protein [Porticoccus sp.]
MSYYFAYGSNMNSDRMAARDLQVLSTCSGWLEGFGLRFNKRSRREATLACANVVYAPGERVEGVLYHLAAPTEIIKLDHHEGAPFRYSRELFRVQTTTRFIPAWTYIANPGVIGNSIKPARWYVEHLLAGKAYLTSEYWDRIDQTPCREATNVIW